jgi:hypothetical protein
LMLNRSARSPASWTSSINTVCRWGVTEMQVTRERRSAPRKKVSLAVLCRSGAERGAGRMVNVSLSGALLEPTSIRPERGAAVKIVFATPGAARPTELSGTAARHTETGFAIQFLAANDGLRELVAQAS